jgi:hypothetical protein
MAHARINILESTTGLIPSSVEVNSDSLDDDAALERVVRNLATLWNIVAVADEAES